MKRLELPRYQYTVRDTKTGMLFLGYSTELSELNARVMVDQVLSRLKTCLPADQITIQTDNGSEVSGAARRIETAPCTQMVTQTHGAKHVYILPGHCNANADVESSHYLIEDEFYELTSFSSKADFFASAETYRLYFNLTRPNFSKASKTPWIIAHQDWPDEWVADKAASLATIDLDKIAKPTHHSGGQSLPELPDFGVGLTDWPDGKLTSCVLQHNAFIISNLSILLLTPARN